MQKPKGEIMKRLRDERKASGLVKVEVWVPSESRQQIKDLEKKLNSQ
jgi:hypothetical protein